MVSLAERRRAVTYLKNEYDISERHACQAMQMNRSSYRYEARQEAMDERYRRVVALSQQYPYWGYRKIYADGRDSTVARAMSVEQGIDGEARLPFAASRSVWHESRKTDEGSAWTVDFREIDAGR